MTDLPAVELMARRVAAVDGAIDRSAVVAARQRDDALELVRHRVDFLAFVSAAVVADAVLPTEDQRRNLHSLGTEHADEN